MLRDLRPLRRHLRTILAVAGSTLRPACRAAPLALLALLAACARPLTGAEVALLAPLHGPTFNPAPVRIHRTPGIDAFPITYDARPRTTCRERIAPLDPRPRITARTAGIVLFQRLFVSPDLALPDYAAEDDTGALPLPLAMFFVHEMTHVWQWQNRRLTGYHPARAFLEQATVDDPYLFEEGMPRFLDYGFEAQASLVEEYLCCATLDPSGARTSRLHALLRQVMPAARPETFPRRVSVPYGRELGGICS
ncbi:hypothetical protein [Jannaschia sp. W003]|uniref:hypothetical protein n=1 Tax=Jannaschia sp. W003 TaxID=2867012 RepID=UPI0021A39B86|nr:hypothetical protein [Jannaschia sp. W003]UWQ20695.1 hypothetical protein K3554_11975 [Jannaschia sp. W003]